MNSEFFMGEKEMSLLGAHWCPDCRCCKQFLGEHQIPYNWMTLNRTRKPKGLFWRRIKERDLFQGDRTKLTKLRLKNHETGTEEEMPVDGAFVFIGLVPNTGFLADSGLILDRWSFIVTGHALLHQRERPKGYEKRDPFLLETSIPDIFAAGDVRDTSTKQVVSAAGEGSSAALMIREYLKMG